MKLSDPAMRLLPASATQPAVGQQSYIINCVPQSSPASLGKEGNPPSAWGTTQVSPIIDPPSAWRSSRVTVAVRPTPASRPPGLTG